MILSHTEDTEDAEILFLDRMNMMLEMFIQRFVQLYMMLKTSKASRDKR